MRKFLLSLVALVGLSTAAALGNYAMTQGAGTTFGSVVVGGTHYAQQLLCDLTTPSQCATVSAAGAVKVDGSAVTQPVSGSVTVSGTVAATQSGTWTVQPGNTANTTPWLVTGSGTAGSAASGVLTVQGIASMTPLFMQSGTVPVSTMNSASANSGVNAAMAGVFDDTSPTAITENSFGFLRMSANRNLYGTIRDAAGNERGANVNASNQLSVTGPVTMASSAVASGAYSSGAFASGAFASGSIASGALASGSIASGAMVDLGAQADAACGTATGTCSLIALTKYLNSSVNSSIPAGTNLIGDVNLRQGGTALSATNGIYSNLLVGNAAVATGTGAQGATSPRVTVATDSATVAGSSSLPAGTNSIGKVEQAVNVTPNNCGGTITTGGTAQNAFTAGATKHGFTIANIDTTEVMWISFTTTAAPSDTQSFPLAPATATTFAGLSSYTTPAGFGMNTALSVVAATTGHKFSCTWW